MRIDRTVPTITFVHNRNLERLRGFDTFMRSLPSIQHRQHSSVRVLIAGEHDRSHGGSNGDGVLLTPADASGVGRSDRSGSGFTFLAGCPDSTLMALFPVAGCMSISVIPLFSAGACWRRWPAAAASLVARACLWRKRN